MTVASSENGTAVLGSTKQLGNSDLQLTTIGFGAWAIGGGDWQYAWGPQDDKDSVKAIHRALDAGINWIDTAAVYGLGHSEEIVGKALRSTSAHPYVFTKCGMTWGLEGENDRKIVQTLKKIREEVEQSLRRLQVETIDLYQIHWPVPDSEIEEGWTAMAELQREEKVRWIGASNFNVGQMERALKIAPITSLQPPYSMINRAAEPEILPFCQEHGIGVINYSPMQSGLLTGAMTKERVASMPSDDFRRNTKQFQEPRISRNLQLAELLRSIGKRHSVEPGVVAIAWTLHNPAVTAAIVGGRNAKQVDGTLPAATFRLSDTEFTEIGSFLTEHP
jgi:aryl-alcohol dehydrogenase-like predicted oxidoreductase